MKIIFIISWRNIWRNPLRSLTIIASVAMGLWAGIFVTSLSNGMISQGFETRIQNQVSHIQIHHPDFLKEKNTRYSISDIEEVFELLDNYNEVVSYSGRTLVEGMIQTASMTRGATIYGIDPFRESSTTSFDGTIEEGDYFESVDRNPIIIGRKLADKMKLEPRSRLVLTFQDIEGNITAASFRVTGIYKSLNTMIEEQNVYVLQSDISRLLGKDRVINEIAILTSGLDESAMIAGKLRDAFPDLTIREWMEIAPDLMYIHESGSLLLLVIVGIILFALSFGLVNTMLMSVFERTREFGMLMSVGMNKVKVFTMILLETSYLALIGAFSAIWIGLGTIALFSRTGIDLSAVGGDSMNDFGYDALVFPALDTEFFYQLIILVIFAAILSAIYPAYKALKLKPAEAVRKE